MPKETAQKVVPMAPKPTVSHVAVTPEQAARWLGGNQVNRTLRASKVNQYARDMVAGRWTLSNDAICFAPDGRLLNGQHRLSAVVKAGVSVLMLIARNMPPESMTTMDSGTARTASDALHFAGESNTNVLAAAAKQAILYSDGRIYKDNKVQAVSHSEIIDFVDLNPSLRHSAHIAQTIGRKVDAPPSPLATAHWIISGRVGTALADHYITQLATRANEPDGSAVLAVDSRLREVRRNRTKFPSRAFIYLLIKGWNYYAADKRVASLAMSPKGEFRIPEPAAWQRA